MTFALTITLIYAILITYIITHKSDHRSRRTNGQIARKIKVIENGQVSYIAL
jgi:hypothetical protein